MPNPYFQFKHFIVHQDKSAMKVCTDSCLFGAWTADYLCRHKTNTESILDIGAGTGLLSLLLAQKVCEARIDAIETGKASAQQAKENFLQSAWKDRLHLFEGRIQDFYPRKKYDFIICNPPFYQNDLLSNNKAKNAAHHHTELTLNDLLFSIKRLLSKEGSFAILLPHRRTKDFFSLAGEAGFYATGFTRVKQTEQHPYFRSMIVFSENKKAAGEDEIVIKDVDNAYTPAFVNLLKDYYLHL